MCRILILFFSLFLTFFSFGQKEYEELMMNWEGVWKGDLKIYTGLDEVQSLPMKLTIVPIDSMTWTFEIVYELEKQDVRAYQLAIDMETPGHLLLDEKNGIILDSWIIADRLYSRFNVNGTVLMTVLYRSGDQLAYEIVHGSDDVLRMTTPGSEVVEGEDIEVLTYTIKGGQFALLTLKD